MTERVYVWDPLVRIFHWSLVLAFIVCYLTGDEENLTHVWSGYIIMGLVGFRVIWGLIGTKHARFSDFITSPATAIASLKDMMAGRSKKCIGHNPLGGWMIIALLLSLLLTGVSGLIVYGLEGYGPLADNLAGNSSMQGTSVGNPVERSGVEHDDDDDEHARMNNSHESDEHEGEEEGDEHEEEEDFWEEFWEEIHEFLANFTVLLIALHVTGVLVSSVRENQNLVKAMFTGYKER